MTSLQELNARIAASPFNSWLGLRAVAIDPAGVTLEAESNAAANSGSQFDYRGGQYAFNLGTKELTQGTYQLSIDLGDGVLRTVNISLR